MQIDLGYVLGRAPSPAVVLGRVGVAPCVLSLATDM